MHGFRNKKKIQKAFFLTENKKGEGKKVGWCGGGGISFFLFVKHCIRA